MSLSPIFLGSFGFEPRPRVSCYIHIYQGVVEYQYCVYKTYEKVFFLLEEYGGDKKGLNLDFLDHFTMSDIDFSKKNN